MSTYRIVTVDLTKVADRKRVVEPGVPLTKVTVRQMPIGATINVSFGDGGTPFPLITQGERFSLCPAERNGMFISVPTVQSGTAILLVSTAEGEVDSLGVGVPGGGDPTVPTSPIVSMVETGGSLNGPATIHLLNVSGSGRLVRLRRARAHISTGNVIKMRRTSSPIDLAGAGGVLTNGTSIRCDERNPATITAEFRGTTFTVGGATFARSAAQWNFPYVDGNGIQEPLDETDFPITIKEGSAVEWAADVNGAGVILRVHAVWDEDG